MREIFRHRFVNKSSSSLKFFGCLQCKAKHSKEREKQIVLQLIATMKLLLLSAFITLLPLSRAAEVALQEASPGTILPTCPNKGVSGSEYFTGVHCLCHTENEPPPLDQLKNKAIGKAKRDALKKYNCPKKCTEGTPPNVQQIPDSVCKKNGSASAGPTASCPVGSGGVGTPGCCVDRNDGYCPGFDPDADPEAPKEFEHCISCTALIDWSISCECDE